MTECMRSSKERYSGLEGVFFDDSLDGTSGESAFLLGTPPIVDEKGLLFVAASFKILFEPF